MNVQHLNSMTLSEKSFNHIASAMVPDVIKYIEQDERYVTFMVDIIMDALQSYLGNIDGDLKGELAVAIMDKISFRG